VKFRFWSFALIGLVIVTHGQLAVELRRATEHVVGPQEALETVCIGPDDDMERRRDDIGEAIKAVSQNNGVIILTDMFGGTPSNLAISMMREGQVEVLAGVNLPMLIKLAEARKTATLDEAALKAKDAGQRYIAIASKILAGET
jgi:PTS system mannose-specific IIA component